MDVGPEQFAHLRFVTSVDHTEARNGCSSVGKQNDVTRQPRCPSDSSPNI
jgi:hypothetical protein